MNIIEHQYFRQFTEIPSPSSPLLTGTFVAVGHRSLTPSPFVATGWRRADGVPILDGADRRRRLQVWLFHGESLVGGG